jgi:imidazolonepropionase-like amidohydrolase
LISSKRDDRGGARGCHARRPDALGLADRIGTLEAGMAADIVIVDGDPLNDIAVLTDRARIARVFEGGRAARSPDGPMDGAS